MHDDPHDTPEAEALPLHATEHDASASTLFTVVGDDPAKQQAIEESASHRCPALRVRARL